MKLLHSTHNTHTHTEKQHDSYVTLYIHMSTYIGQLDFLVEGDHCIIGRCPGCIDHECASLVHIGGAIPNHSEIQYTSKLSKYFYQCYFIHL